MIDQLSFSLWCEKNGVLTITSFCQKHRLKEDAKTELIIMQAFHQGIAMLFGAAVGFALGYVAFVVF